MKKVWQQQVLDGDGLQSINLNYIAQKKDSKKAYLLAAFYLFGLHQFYLGNKKRGVVYCILTIAVLITMNFAVFIGALIAFAQIIMMFIDVKQIENQVATFNKNLKMELAFQQNNKPPHSFKGRFVDDNAQANADGSHQAILSFAEQEALIRQMNREKQNKETK